MDKQDNLSIVKNLYNFNYENKNTIDFINNEGAKIPKKMNFLEIYMN